MFKFGTLIRFYQKHVSEFDCSYLLDYIMLISSASLIEKADIFQRLNESTYLEGGILNLDYYLDCWSYHYY